MPANIITKSPREVIVFDHLNPEAGAMSLAMYSRDPRSVNVHLEKIAESGPEKFMGQFYVGYGHDSIGDCGSTYICAEYVSMLAAKAIQDNELYNGQEASTRYLDMNTTGVLNPLGTEQGEHIQRSWMSLYNIALERLPAHLREKYPMTDKDMATEKSRKDYEKAIEKKSFDIARGFLPAGCLTFVGWHATLRDAYKHTREMRYHPLAEVRGIGEEMFSALKEKYPSSFGQRTELGQDEYYRKCAEHAYVHMNMHGSEFRFAESINRSEIRSSSLINDKRGIAKIVQELRPDQISIPS
jgi:thymidylate synthase ThyX